MQQRSFFRDKEIYIRSFKLTVCYYKYFFWGGGELVPNQKFFLTWDFGQVLPTEFIQTTILGGENTGQHALLPT
jgi:hypothetical protein